MVELKIIDSVLAPKPEISMKFKCKNPFLIYSKIKKILQETLKVSGKDIYEHVIKWDDSSVNREFYCYWHGQDEYDQWTSKKIFVKAQGVQNAETKIGWVHIRIKGQIETEMDYSNPLKKMFFVMYNKMFYSKQRRMYVDDATKNIKEIISEIRNMYNIPEGE